MKVPPKRGRRRRAWLEGYAEARGVHYVPVDDGFFATLEDLSPDPETLYRIDYLRRERDNRTGPYAPHLMARMGLSDGTPAEDPS